MKKLNKARKTLIGKRVTITGEGIRSYTGNCVDVVQTEGQKHIDIVFENDSRYGMIIDAVSDN